MNYDFDLFVIGAGSGGIATARRAAQYGAKVGIVEFDRLGGTCVNRGCIPKKLMVYAGHFPEKFEEAQGYGWSAVESTLDWTKMITSVRDEVTRLNGIYQNMLDNSQVQLFEGYGKFVDPHTIAIGDTQVTAEKILIAVGGKPVKPDISGMEYTIVSDDIFNLPQQPKRIVIIGGGYIGVEFACIFNGLGSEVTLISRGHKILRGFDEDIRTEVQEGMERHGIRVININDGRLKAIEKTDEGLKIFLDGDTEPVAVADCISLTAIGRIPNIQELGIENTKVEVKNGAIVVDEFNQTAESHIYAVGDCTDRINLTPVAIAEGRAFADTHFGNMDKKMSYENIPTAVFSSPEAATVGLSETEARAKYGDAIEVYRSKFRSMYYVLPGKQEKTLIKVIVDKNTDKVVGAHMVGNYAAEIMQGVAIAVKMGATKADFDATVAIHPSSAEEFVLLR
jgi:glutathione reductase (NADPH)